MKNLIILQLFVVLLLCSVSEITGQSTMLPSIALKGENGGTADGKEWNSSNLTGKINLILYVDPGKKESATPLIDKIDSLNYAPDSLGITFIVNTQATFIPDFLIQKMIKSRAEENKNILYVLDQNKVLIKEWKLTEENINVLIIDSSGKTLHRHDGEITEEYINKLISRIDNVLKKK